MPRPLVAAIALLLAGVAPIRAVDAPGLAVVEAFTDGSPAGLGAEAAAEGVAGAKAPGSIVLVFHIPKAGSFDPTATRRGTMVARGHDADAGAQPALLVNGVVTAAPALDAAVTAALATPPQAAPVVSCGWWSSLMWVGIAVPGAPAGTLVTLALVEDGLSVAGSPHDGVVRSYKTVSVDGSAKPMDVDLTIPEGTVRTHSSVVAVVQDAAGRVIGVARCEDRGE